MAWKVLDLCCGLGGLSVGAKEIGCSIVAGADLSAEALETFAHNFPGATTVRGSIASAATVESCKIAMATSPLERTLIVSGPPCQGFSAAGARKKRDPRNRVLPAVARAIAELGPDAAIIENVSTLTRTRHQANLRRLTKTLKLAGYETLVLELNASDFGVPQNRHRVICLVTRKALSRDRVESELALMHALAPSVAVALRNLGVPVVHDPALKKKARIPNHVAMRHSLSVKRKIAGLLPGEGPMSYRKLDPNTVSRTLISGNRAPPAHFSQSRSITVREAARLQGFADTFVVKGVFSKQMTLITNAVPPPLAKAVIGALLSQLRTAV